MPQKTTKEGKYLHWINFNSIKHKDVREIGTEWLSYQALVQLSVGDFLQGQGWGQDEVRLALTHIISRAAYPASELCTARWAKESSSICEITGYDIGKMNKDRLYAISLMFFSEHGALEQDLSKRTNELFDI